MTGSPPLPPGFILRPARATDKAQIRQFLVRLQQETMPVEQRSPWMVGILFAGLLVASWFLFGKQLFFQIAIGYLVLLIVIGLNRFNRGEWVDFWVIDHAGEPVACAKLSQFSDYSTLFDLFVRPEWRKQGLGSALVNHLGQIARKPLYLACAPATVPFYIRLGFHRVPVKKLSPLLQYKLGIPSRSRIVPLVLL